VLVAMETPGSPDGATSLATSWMLPDSVPVSRHDSWGQAPVLGAAAASSQSGAPTATVNASQAVIKTRTDAYAIVRSLITQVARVESQVSVAPEAG
jgi:hypothetical protein